MKRLAVLVVVLAACGATANAAAPTVARPVVNVQADCTKTDVRLNGTSVCPTTTTGVPPSTSTTVPATTTTTTTLPSTTNPPTSTTTTTTTTLSTTTTVPSASKCSLQKADAAVSFCETFDKPHNGGTRTGDLDPVLWGVSRIGVANPGQSQFNEIADTSLSACGSGTISPPADVKVCNEQLVEGQNDNHGVVNLDMYPKQPFDFTGRTGTVGFDVGDDSEGVHAAWPEFIITDKPVPGARSDISNTTGQGAPDVAAPAAANEIGINFDTGCTNQQNTVGVGKVYVTRNSVFREVPVTYLDCVAKGSPAAMNHVEVRISTDQIDVYMSDGGSSTLKHVATASGLGLLFSRGLVWMTDSHYNADKFPNPNGQRVHTFTWDNLAFDGPKTYRDLGFDVPDQNVHDQGCQCTDEGYTLPAALTVTGVHHDQAPTAAQVVFNYWVAGTAVPSVSVNGNTFIDTSNPFAVDGLSYAWRTISIPIPLSQVVDGTNTVAFKSVDGSTIVANISLILVAASAVP